MRFADIIGQKDVIDRLRKAKSEDHVAHAQLFLGPEGSGNLALALAYAQFLNCPNATPEDSCGTCPTCRKNCSFQFADLHFSFPYFNKTGSKETISDDFGTEWRNRLLLSPYFGVEDWTKELSKDNKQLIFSVPEAANIVRKLSLKSFEGGYKVMVIWMAEMIGEGVANKLLKIVEEPPANTLFFFVANSSENILNTILSRVQVIQVPKIDKASISAGLKHLGVDDHKIPDISHYSDGSWDVALRLRENNDPNEFLAMQFQTWMRHCYSKKIPALHAWSEKMAELTREDLKHFLLYALDQMRQNLVLNYTSENISRFTSSERAFAQKFSPFINHLNIEDIMLELEAAHRSVGQNVNNKILFFELSMRIFRLLNRKETA
jgi:DNA polymerase III subunit delta'